MSACQSQPLSTRRLLLCWAALSLLAILTRLPYILHDRQLDDECYYGVIGIEILEGGDLYVSVVDRKPPLVYYTYAALFDLLGRYNWQGLHAFSVVWTLLTMLGLFALCRGIFDDRAGLAAALLYLVFLPTFEYHSLAFNGEMLLNLPLVWALVLTFRGSRSRWSFELIAAGALLCTAILYKQTAAIEAIPFGLYLLLPSYRRARTLSAWDSLVHAGLLVLGFGVVLGTMVAWLAGQGVLSEALYWVFQTDFVHGVSDPVFWERAMRNGILYFALPSFPLLLGLVRTLLDARRGGSYLVQRRAEYLGLLMLLVVSVIGVSSSGRFFPHYFIQVLPAATVLAAPPMAAILTGTSRYRSWLFGRRLMTLGIAGCTLFFLTIHAIYLPRRPGPGPAAEYVREHSSADERIFVWGPSPNFYLDVQRRPASRYVGTFPLSGYPFGSPLASDPDYDTRHRIHPGAWERFAEDIAASPPLFIIDEYSAMAGGKYAPDRYPYLRDLLDREYNEVERTERTVVYRRDVGAQWPGQSGSR